MMGYTLYSQTQKGSFMAGIGINYQHTKQNTVNNNNRKEILSSQGFNGLLPLGYFIRDNIAAGILGGYATSSSDQTVDNSNQIINNSFTEQLVSAGLFTRVYKFLSGNNLGVFCQLEGLYQTGNAKTSYVTTWNNNRTEFDGKRDIYGVNIRLRPGIVYFITKQIGLEGSLGSFVYSNQTTQHYESGIKTSKTTSNGVNLNFGLNYIFIGVNFYFLRKNE